MSAANTTLVFRKIIVHVLKEGKILWVNLQIFPASLNQAAVSAGKIRILCA